MAWYETIKLLFRAAEVYKNRDLYKQLDSLGQENSSLKSRVQQLTKENQAIKHELKIQGELEFRNNSYYVKQSDGTLDGPFCQVCWDADGKLMRLQEGATRGFFFCAYCSLGARRSAS